MTATENGSRTAVSTPPRTRPRDTATTGAGTHNAGTATSGTPATTPAKPDVVQPPPRPAPTARVPAHVTLILGRAGRSLGTPKIKDVSKGAPWKVNLYQDDGHATLNRAKVDLDRDDKWDEKWTLAGGTITRKRAPADDENYTVEERWNGERWVAK